MPPRRILSLAAAVFISLPPSLPSDQPAIPLPPSPQFRASLSSAVPPMASQLFRKQKKMGRKKRGEIEKRKEIEGGKEKKLS
jgi:hypothetical protein